MRQSAGAIRRTMLAVCVAGLVALGLVPTAAGAQARDVRAKEAKTACAAGDVAKGDRLLGELYTATKDPTWIFQQGRCLQQNKASAQALERYQEYLGKAKTAAKSGAATKTVAEAEGHVKTLEAEIAAQNKKPTPSEPAPAAEAAPSAAEQATSAPPPAAPQAVAATAPAPASGSGGRGLVVAGVGLEILGAAALITGGVFSYLVHKQGSDAADMTSAGKVALGSDLRTKQADGNHFSHMQWVFYGIGGVAAATGLALHIIGSPKSSAKPTAQLTPALSPSAWGLTLSVRL